MSAVKGTRRIRRGAAALTKPQQKQVRKLALSVTKKQSETKVSCFTQENNQLYHSQPFLHHNMLYTTHGVDSGDKPGIWTNRIGDEIYLQSLNVRLHLFNKQDRPNVHYRFLMFWYEAGVVPTINDVLDAQGNLMITKPNRETVSIITDRIIPAVYPGPHGSEFSRIVKINKRYKNKKIVYNDSQNVNSTVPKMKDVGWMLLAYDAYGTLTTDNIASFAVQYDVKFKEN